MPDNIAAIDVGTNTSRLLVASPDSTEQVRPLLLKRQITRLGGGFSRETGLSSDARKRTIATLADFAAAMKEQGVGRYRAVATSAVRDAKNGACFVEEALSKTGIRLDVIDGTEEALLTLRGVESSLDDRSSDCFVFDVGGGSTEYTFARKSVP